MRRNFCFRAIIGSKDDQRVIELAVFLQRFIQVGEHIIHFYHAIAVRGPRG